MAIALWSVGVRKAKVMTSIMMAFNQVERDIYIRGVDANTDLDELDVMNQKQSKDKIVSTRPFYMINPLSMLNLLHASILFLVVTFFCLYVNMESSYFIDIGPTALFCYAFYVVDTILSVFTG